MPEADRTEQKHLLTLEAVISVKRTEEMKAARIQMILPVGMHDTYTQEQRKRLYSVEDFLREIKEKQRHTEEQHMIWIEMSRDEVHGGGEWSFAKCVWSPVHKNAQGRNQTWLFWENVKKVKKGDIVLHLQGKGKNACFTGYSVAGTDGHETNERPPEAGDWAYSNSFYRAFLKDLTSLEKPVHLYTVFREKEEAFRAYLGKKKSPKNLFYTEQSGKLQCLNGGYLSEADEELVALILGKQEEGDSKEEQMDRVVRSVSTNEAFAQIKRRIGHKKFAENVKRNYGNHCCFPDCDVTDDNFLIASHITRWADNEKNVEKLLMVCVCA